MAREFRSLVDRYFRENWPLERYEQELGTTAHLLAKACRTAFGVSPKEFIGERRMLEAKRLLLFTVRPVEDIAYELGLKDAAYFSRFFKERVGEPPASELSVEDAESHDADVASVAGRDGIREEADGPGEVPFAVVEQIAATAEGLAKTINSFKGRVSTLFIAHHLPKGLAIDEVIQLDGGAAQEKHMSVVS